MSTASRSVSNVPTHQPMDPSSATPAFYAACLASYNAGHLHGKWIPLLDESGEARTRAELWGHVQHMLSESPEDGAEEWAVHDTNALPEPLRGEHTPLEAFATFGAMLEEHPGGPEQVHTFIEEVGLDVGHEDWIRELEDACFGVWDSPSHFVESQIRGDTEELPGYLRRHIDIEGIVREWEHSGWQFPEVKGTRREHGFGRRVLAIHRT